MFDNFDFNSANINMVVDAFVQSMSNPSLSIALNSQLMEALSAKPAVVTLEATSTAAELETFPCLIDPLHLDIFALPDFGGALCAASDAVSLDNSFPFHFPGSQELSAPAQTTPVQTAPVSHKRHEDEIEVTSVVPSTKRRKLSNDASTVPTTVVERSSFIVHTHLVNGKIKSDSRKKITPGCTTSTFEKEIKTYIRLGQTCDVFEYDVKEYIKSQMDQAVLDVDYTPQTVQKTPVDNSSAPKPRPKAGEQAQKQYAEACVSYMHKMESIHRWTFYSMRIARAIADEGAENEDFAAIQKRILDVMGQQKQDLHGRIEKLRQAKRKMVKWANKA